MKEQMAECINILADFLGKRDVEELTKEQLKKKYNIDHADVMVLFGGSIMCGGDVLAEAMKNKAAEKYIIVGGAGHTTETLRQMIHDAHPSIITDGLSEAEVFNCYLKTVYGKEADLLETRSTNCGNNITYLLDLLKENNISFSSIILTQDASMQRRMEAGLRKYVEDDVLIINYAAYHAHVIADHDELKYASEIPGMWNMERYAELLMGEIPRLTDDENGYGPNGKDYISHVDIPDEVRDAFEMVLKESKVHVREANPLFASK